MARLWSVLLTVAILAGCESALPAPTATPLTRPSTTTAMPATPIGVLPSQTEQPRVATPAPIATPCTRPTPSLVLPLVLQNGNLDLNVPYWLGFVQFFLVPCRDITMILARYGLGPATLVITEPSTPNADPDDIRSRYYKASVPVGAEAAFVARLAAHPEDFQYVEFAFVPVSCVISCAVRSSIEPNEGPAGTSFKMRICCFDGGTSVTKTFTLPSGRTLVIPDTAGPDRTVPAGWGGSAGDERGLYTVFVTTDQIGSTVRFRIR